MGLFDKFKNIFGGDDKGGDAPTKSMTQLAREAGIDTSQLRFQINSDGVVTVTGNYANANDKGAIQEAFNGVPGITGVNDQATVAAGGTSTGVDTTERSDIFSSEPAAGEAEADTDEAHKTYTVESGDTLWKISQQFYGDGSQYMRIFEANTDKLDDPDKIFPGQELIIPPAPASD